MSEQQRFEFWFSKCRSVDILAVEACRYMDGYVADCIRMSGIEIAWSAWKESKKPR